MNGCNEGDVLCPPKISVVVPVYNTEQYLRECVDSVLAQTFNDFELVLVDDGSPDKSGEICDELANKDQRIRVFHKENAGSTVARKFGVEESRGEWIYFLDSDDLLPKTALESLFSGTKKYDDDVDLIEGGNVRFASNSEIQNFDFSKPHKERENLIATGLEYSKMIAICRSRGGETGFTGTRGKIVRKRVFTGTNVFNVPRGVLDKADVLMCMNFGKTIRKAIRFYEAGTVYLYRINNKNRTKKGLPKKGRMKNYSQLYCEAAKDSFVGMGAEWQEVWKLAIIGNFLAFFENDHEFSPNAPWFRPYLDVLLERKDMLSPTTKFFLLATKFPLSLVPISVFRHIADLMRFPRRFLRNLRRSLKRKSSIN